MLACEKVVPEGKHKGRTATGTSAGYQRHRKAGETACAPCRSAWSIRNGTWASAHKASRRLTREKRRGIETQWMREWRHAHPELVAALRKKYYDPEKQYERCKRWTEANREAVRLAAHRRRAAQNSALTILFTANQLAERMAYWGDQCWMCQGPYEAVDHVMAISRGGPHCLANLRPACKSCNSRKKDRDWREFHDCP